MLIVIQFPIADFRGFHKSNKLIKKPTWPMPIPDIDFVRYFGSIRHRKKGGLIGWVGENEICEVTSSISFSYCPQIYSFKKGFLSTRVVFKRLYFDGNAVAKFEIGIATKSRKGITLSSKDLETYLDNLLKTPIRLRAIDNIKYGRAKFDECILGCLGKKIVNLYHYASVKHDELQVHDENDIHIRHCPPLIFIQCQEFDNIRLPHWSKSIDTNDPGLFINSCLIPFQGGVDRRVVLALIS